MLALLPLLLALSVVTFALMQLAPGDPAETMLQRGGIGGLPPRDEVERLRRELGLDDPAPVQYLRWLRGVARGDFGDSYRSGQPVAGLLRDVVPPTLLLMGCGLAIAWSLALVAGTAVGLRPDSGAARLIGGVIVVLQSVPSFVVALLALFLVAGRLRWLPVGGMTDAGAEVSVAQVGRHVLLPAMALGISYFGWYARSLAASVSDTRRAPFVDVARARGLPPALLLRRHVLRAALIPFVAQIGVSFGALVGGAYAIEVIFTWPGAGRTAVQAANGRDYPVLMALTLLSGVLVLLGNLAADIAVARLDPRIRISTSGRSR